MDPDRALDALRRSGPLRAGDLQRALDVPGATMRRGLAGVRASILTAGRARATTYAARRAIPGLFTPTPIYEVAPDGGVRHALTLHPVEPFGCWVEPHTDDVTAGFFEADPADLGPDAHVDLPWFLGPLRPEGFLGRLWLRNHGDAGLPADLGRWTGDDVLRFAAHHEPDLPGAWLVGAAARDRWLSEDRWSGAPTVAQLDALLPDLAARAVRGEGGGSSPGGEQPKLSVRVWDGDRPVTLLVKFTAPRDAPVGERWADLLVAENVAHEVLRESGIEACRSRVIDSGGRRFLVIERFDRHGRLGRSGTVSLRSLDRDGAAADLRRWRVVTAGLVRDGHLAAPDHARVEWLEAFGHLIANTDTHPGNLSLRLRGARVLGLAPVYDMLPMFHAPRASGEVRADLYDARAALDEAPASAREAAVCLWSRVADHPAVSAGYAAMARRQAERAAAVPSSGN